MKKQSTPNQRLAERHQKSGLSVSTVRLRVYDLVGGYAPTEQTLTNWLNGTTKKLDVVILLALCEVYDCQLSDIDPELSEAIVKSRDLLVRRTSWCSELAGAAL